MDKRKGSARPGGPLIRRHSGTPVSGMQPGTVRGAGRQEQAKGPSVDVWDGRL